MSTLTSDAPRLRSPGAQDHKYSRGKLLVVGGAMAGAATLAALAAQRVGIGYVELADDMKSRVAPPYALVRRGWDAVLLDDPRVTAIVVGPGLGLDDAAKAKLAACLATDKPLLLDADALTLLAQGHPLAFGPRFLPLLTPHEGEFGRLFPTIEGSRHDRALAAARACGAVVLLKGSQSVLAHPDGRVFTAPAASPWLATAGTGDVLAGIAGGLLAGGFEAFAAGQGALWLHAEVARLAGPFLIADDLITHLPTACAACL